MEKSHKNTVKPRRSDISISTIVTRSSSGVSYLKPITRVRSAKEVYEYKKDIVLDDHLLSIEEISIRYGTDIDTGLDKEIADQLLELHGPNCLVAPPSKSKLLALIGYIFGGFNVLLWIGAILTFIGYGLSCSQEGLEKASVDPLYLGGVLLVVIFFSGFFGFYQEKTSSAIMESFKKMVPKFAMVIRSGSEYAIPSEEIVQGDLVKLYAGDVVPADIRIIEAQNMKVDNSAITGESCPLNRSNECTEIDPLETVNLAFYGTNVVEGSGTGIVIKCGDHTVIGRIAGLTSSLEKTETLIHKELKRFVRIVTIIAVCLGFLIFTSSMIIGYSFFKSFIFFIAIVIANVPEGLPIALTACMSLTAKRMAKKNCLVKKLECIETLGACNVICSDKTGTLTQNKMTASHLFYDSNVHDVLTNLESIDREADAYEALSLVAILCSRATFLDGDLVPIGSRRTTGDASESAILKIMEQLEGNVVEKRKEYPKVCEIPFNSTNKYQASVHIMPSGRYLVVMKGAPEKVVDHCNCILRDGEIIATTPLHLKPIKKAITHLSTQGERVLAFADLLLPPTFGPDYKFNSDKPNFPLKGLRFVGMISLIDPPRPSVPDAVSKCRSAGIRVIMVTGDHPVTALAIARKVGIISSYAMSAYDLALKDNISLSKVSEIAKTDDCTAAVITGSDLREMSESELERLLKTFPEIVFARTSPQQKLKIVEAFQRLEKVVAVTGDGVNDSPALKKADIGIAMGITGSDVSKEAADMILMDDNFASIVTGIEEGRLIFDNLKKSIAYELTSNVPEIAPFLCLLILDIPESLTIMAIIVIDVGRYGIVDDSVIYQFLMSGTDLWPAISLAYEKPETDIMTRHPRNPKKDKLINSKLIFLTYGQIGVIQACASYTSFFFMMGMQGFPFKSLIGIRPDWENKHITSMKNVNGKEFSFEDRDHLLHQCITGYFLSIVMTQIADLLICKTRKLSLFQQGMGNHVLNAGLMFEIFLAGVVVYCPYINRAFQMEPINLIGILPAIPYAIFIILYDEMRKMLIRKFPKGWVYRYTYY
ncbi:LOW QUALITY PROTEIN: sodium/potassium-transporting ATPase subunit alpha-4-like [Anoplophora glabripennis]|uniref:LOW QUALITY PROTEIN: sodium/potassium-transporting ATPase subunit alpha-4-like n=1 Tax=Anoplophora glabripennis TaxID=217634 RepID=UPI000C783F75|nr:LOW QUALITY PROTEIN: sodium/potassium-transporting ATPase subunit alpha-4-like [Anoplophora glabripennis]